mgnify:CR=1 FL=1
MAKDLNPRQLRFVTEYLKSGIQSRAFILAGYQRSTRNALDVGASQLIRNRKVKREINRRKAAMVKRSDVTIDKLLQDLADDRDLARRIDQPSAAIAATQLTAKLVGLLVDRKETGAPGDFQGLTTADEVLAAIRAEMGEDAAKALQALVNKASPPVTSEPEQPVIPTAQGSDSLN